jgi:hypothetical protein
MILVSLILLNDYTMMAWVRADEVPVTFPLPTGYEAGLGPLRCDGEAVLEPTEDEGLLVLNWHPGERTPEPLSGRCVYGRWPQKARFAYQVHNEPLAP